VARNHLLVSRRPGLKMRDPHVAVLHYRVVTDTESFEFKADAPPIERDEAAFRVRLGDGALTATMKDHYPSADEARAVVTPFLDAWEIVAALARRSREMRFEFDHADVVDRNPPGPGEPIEAAVTFEARAGCSVAAKLIAASYPEPPVGFVASEDVRTLMYHYENYVAGRRPLLDMAYFTLTLLHWRAGTPREASVRYGVADDVLRTLGRLTSTRGDEREARKLNRASTLTPLTDREREWIEAVVRALIRRVGEYDADPTATRPTITMADLPALA
jgi:hypothetical protein